MKFTATFPPNGVVKLLDSSQVVFKGTFQPGQSYLKNDVVAVGESRYMAVYPNSGHPPGDFLWALLKDFVVPPGQPLEVAIQTAWTGTDAARKAQNSADAAQTSANTAQVSADAASVVASTGSNQSSLALTLASAALATASQVHASSTAGTGVDVVAAQNLPAYAAVTVTGSVANSSTTAHYGKVVGLAEQFTSPGFVATAVYGGEITNESWAWRTGDTVFLNGTILSSAAPNTGFSQSFGVAKTDVSVLVKVSYPILL